VSVVLLYSDYWYVPGHGVRNSVVTINGKNATVTGNTFSVKIPLAVGINSLSAIATDIAGHQTTSSAVTVFRYESATSGESTNTANGTMNTDSTKNISSSNSANNALSSNSEEKIPTKVANSTEVSQTISTPVKAGITAGALAGTGLAIASYLGYIPYRRIGLFITKLLIR
jgi:flagellar capping protein FliD